MLKTYFEKYGHKCNKDLDKPFQKVLEDKSQLRKWLLKYSIISQNYILLRCHPQSHASLRKAILYHLENYPYALHPFSALAYYLDAFWGIAVLIFFILKPLQILEHMYPKRVRYGNNQEYATAIFSFLCILDCSRRFFTGYVVKSCNVNVVILDYKLIALQYLKTYFFFDLISALPGFISLIFESKEIYQIILELVSMLRVIRVVTMNRAFRNVLRFYHFNHTLIDVFNGVTILILIMHWVSCYSVLPGTLERINQTNKVGWYNQLLDQDSSTITKYIVSVNRSLSILTGKGYNFIYGTAGSENDLIYTIFSTVLGHIITLVIFAKLYEVINGIRSASDKYGEMLCEISNYMKHLKLSKVTQDKIKTYYGFKYGHTYFNEYELLSSLPISLQQNILMYSSKLLLENIEYLAKLPISVVTNIVLHMAKKKILLAGDVIYRSGEADASMFFLLSGTVALFTRMGRELFHFEDGSEFGQSPFVKWNGKHFNTAVAIETTELFKLRAEDIRKLIDYCPDLVKLLDRLAHSRLVMSGIIEERFKQMYNRSLLQIGSNTENQLVIPV